MKGDPPAHMDTRRNPQHRPQQRQPQGYPPPPRQQQQAPQVRRAGVAAGKQMEQPPPPQPSQSGAGAWPMFKQKPPKPAKKPGGGGGGGAPQPANKTWLGYREPAFNHEVEGLLACNTPKVAHLANRLASKYKDSPIARHLAGRLLEEQAEKVQNVEKVPPNTRTFSIYHDHVREHSEEVANKMCRSFLRIEPLLRHAVKAFITELNLEQEWKEVSNEPPRLEIVGIPAPGSIQALADFLDNQDNELVKRTQIHGDPDNVVVAEITKLGRSLFLGFLEYIVAQHEQNKSWGGLFSINDLQVTNGCMFEISKLAKVPATPQAMANDMKRLAELLMRYYRRGGFLPVYFLQLEADLKECKSGLGTYKSAKTVKFQKYLKGHLALKSPVARGHLFLDLYRVRQALGKDDRAALSDFLKGKGKFEWTPEAVNHVLLRKVLHFGVDENDNRKSASTESQPTYQDNLDHLLIYLRHATEHGTDHTKDDTGMQKIKNLIEVDLLIEKYLGIWVMCLIRTLLDYSKMEGDMFEGIWTEFANSRS